VRGIECDIGACTEHEDLKLAGETSISTKLTNWAEMGPHILSDGEVAKTRMYVFITMYIRCKAAGQLRGARPRGSPLIPLRISDYVFVRLL